VAWFEDLSCCDYFGAEFADVLQAVGWLQRGHDFPQGAADRRVFDRLEEFRKDPWQPAVTAGPHQCDLCSYDGAFGTSNLFVPGGGKLFVCPELITHYMNAHQYRPPEEFCRAVLACPPMKSQEYLKIVLANGGRALVKRCGG
jgi:hypothetical protein